MANRAGDAFQAAICSALGQDPFKFIDYGDVCGTKRILQMKMMGTTWLDMDPKIRKLQHDERVQPDQKAFVVELLKLQESFLTARSKAGLTEKWTCVMWANRIVEIGYGACHHGQLVFADETQTRWIVTRKYGTSCPCCLKNEVNELANAWFCLLTYLGMRPQYVRGFGWGSPLPCDFPIKAFDDRMKAKDSNGFLQKDITNFMAVLSKKELKQIDRVVATSPEGMKIVEAAQKEQGGRDTLAEQVICTENREYPRFTGPQPAEKCKWCDATAEQKGLPKLLRCAQCQLAMYCSRGCQVSHWKASHKILCKGQKHRH